MADDKSRGLYGKFSVVKRADGRDTPGEKHDGCRYFVLDLTHDPLAAPAIEAYADAAEAVGYRALAHDLRSIDVCVDSDGDSEPERLGHLRVPYEGDSVVAGELVEAVHHRPGTCARCDESEGGED